MLKSYEAVYEKGQFEWLGDAPTVEKARVVITIIEEMPIQNHRRQPPPELKGSVAWKGAPFDPEIEMFPNNFLIIFNRLEIDYINYFCLSRN